MTSMFLATRWLKTRRETLVVDLTLGYNSPLQTLSKYLRLGLTLSFFASCPTATSVTIWDNLQVKSLYNSKCSLVLT